jgi:hypothetical protein
LPLPLMEFVASYHRDSIATERLVVVLRQNVVQTSLEEELAEERARREQAEWESDELRRLLESRSEATEAPETAGGGSESHRDLHRSTSGAGGASSLGSRQLGE